jgi:hypothetical protein
MILKSKSLAYDEIKIDDEGERMAFYEKCGPAVRQMPQVFINPCLVFFLQLVLGVQIKVTCIVAFMQLCF